MMVVPVQPAGSTLSWKTDTDASGNVTYTAQFSYTVTIHANDGTINAGDVSSYLYGTGVTLPTDVTREGYAFGGWYDNSGFTGTAVTQIGTTDTGNKEYWAKWNQAVSYTVTFKVANGKWDDNTDADKTVTLNGYEGDTLKLTAGQIPAVGTKPNDTNKVGSWNATPSTDTAITAATTYTYTYTAKEAASVTKAPAAKTLTFNGTAQELVTAGEASGGMLYYAVTTENTAPTDESLYTTSIPTATDTGTYYVWYKVDGDANHNDYRPNSVTVTINPVDKAALNAAIADAEAYYNRIKDKAEYADIAATLKKAIDTAKAAAANDNLAEGDVKKAIDDANAAFEAAKADGAAVDKQLADAAAAKKVTDAISALPANAGVADKAAVEAARAAYDALDDDQKQLVGEALQKLADAEAQVKAAEEAEQKASEKRAANVAAAKKVTDAISALPESAGVADKAAVEAARAAYDALDDDQKKLVGEEALQKLATAEAQVKAAEEAIGTDIATCTVAVKDRTYTGKALKPAVTVKDGETTLTAGTDYTVTYKNNKNAGTATVTVKGIGGYSCSKQATFKILKASIAKCAFAVKHQTYSGKKMTPAVTVMFGKVKLKKGTDYTVTYKNNRNVGTAMATVKGKGNFKGSKVLTFKIKPKGTTFSKLTAGNRTMTLKWKRQKNITGYQIQYSRKKDFSIRKRVTIKKATELTKTIKKLKANGRYYVRIRTYKVVKEKMYFSAWSKIKAVRVKGTSANGAVQPIETTLNVGDELDLKTLLPDVDFESPVTWASSDEGVAMVSESGIAHATATGEAIITVTEEDGEAISIILTVNAVAQGVDSEEASVPEIEALMLSLDDDLILSVDEGVDGDIELDSIEG